MPRTVRTVRIEPGPAASPAVAGSAAVSPRVVSLIASSTEIVCALGCEHLLVGRSHECDYPPSVRRLPACTDPKFVTDGTSYDIDERVKAILQEGLSVYRVDAERLRALRPDVVVTQTQCEVCAVSLRDVEVALAQWLDRPPVVVSLEPNALEDVWADIRRVAAALGTPERGDALVDRLQARMKAIAERARALPEKPRVACIEWIEPLMAAGNWMPELVERAGGVNLFGEAGKHSPWMTWADLEAADPDVVIVLPCGFDLQRTRQEMPALTARPEWTRLRAVRNRAVYLLDGNQYFNRPGPRLVESLEILAEIFHPAEFRFGHEGVGWERL
ncbi:MAG: cobalamin-binding protein [Gemmatimonadetes bacterium]|nr:cobalamin-binding protein [Gemmatimonadota bacterium]